MTWEVLATILFKIMTALKMYTLNKLIEDFYSGYSGNWKCICLKLNPCIILIFISKSRARRVFCYSQRLMLFVQHQEQIYCFWFIIVSILSIAPISMVTELYHLVKTVSSCLFSISNFFNKHFYLHLKGEVIINKGISEQLGIFFVFIRGDVLLLKHLICLLIPPLYRR